MTIKYMAQWSNVRKKSIALLPKTKSLPNLLYIKYKAQWSDVSSVDVKQHESKKGQM